MTILKLVLLSGCFIAFGQQQPGSGGIPQRSGIGVERPGARPSLSDALDQLSAVLDADPRVSAARQKVEATDHQTTPTCTNPDSAICLNGRADLRAAQAAHAHAQATVANDRMALARVRSEELEELVKRGPDLTPAWQPLRNLVETCGKDRTCIPIKKMLYTHLSNSLPEQHSALRAVTEVIAFLHGAIEHYHKVTTDQEAQYVLLLRDSGELRYLAALRAAIENTPGNQGRLDFGTRYYVLAK